MNRANKSIGWCDWTWNPIKGLCPTGCWYCYARRMYKRFKWNPKLRLGINYPLPIAKIPPGSKIFVCSTCELFHPQVPKEWRDKIFKHIEFLGGFTFQILTKFPQNIDREMPDNVWLGCTINYVDHSNDLRLEAMAKARARRRFISFEPLFSQIQKDYIPKWLDWIIVGRLTGFGRKYDPPNDWIYGIVNCAIERRIPIFLKDNLKEIWGENLIQELPE